MIWKNSNHRERTNQVWHWRSTRCIELIDQVEVLVLYIQQNGPVKQVNQNIVAVGQEQTEEMTTNNLIHSQTANDEEY